MAEGTDPLFTNFRTGTPMPLSDILDALTGSGVWGDILYRGQNAWTLLSAGTSGQLLQTQGPGANPIWGGGLTTISSGNLTGTNVDITNISESFSALVLSIVGASSDTATRQVIVRGSVDNGGTFDTTAGNYRGTLIANTTPASSTLATFAEHGANVAAATAINMTLIILNYQANGGFPLSFWASTDTAANRSVGGSIYIGSSTNNIDALSILWNGSGSFDAGTYLLRGI